MTADAVRRAHSSLSSPISDESRPRSYVGVSGVADPAQRAWLTGWFHALGLGTHRSLLLGVKATHKSQFEDRANKYGPAWYPVGPDAFARALAPAPTFAPQFDDPVVLGIAQVYLEPRHVDDPGYRREFIARLVDRGAPWLTGVQFDLLPWHLAPWVADFLAEIRERYLLQVLLQCHGPAMDHLGPLGVATALAVLAPSIDHVLFDSSHGTGTRLDADALTPFLDAAYGDHRLAAVGFGVAGGLHAGVVTNDLSVILERYPDLSFDAEGALHPPRLDASRPLDLLIAADYLRAAATATTREDPKP